MQPAMETNQDVIVVIPAYNEIATIRVVVISVLAHVGRVIVVDDCSTDDTASAIADLPIIQLRNEQNLGKAASLMRGFAEALRLGAKQVISFDADGQHDANDLPRLLRAAVTKPEELIIAARLIGCEKAPRSRLYANRIADFFISWVCNQRIFDTQSGFRLYPAAFLAHLDIPHDKEHGFAFESQVLITAAQAKISISAIPIVSHYSYQQRPSYFRPQRDLSCIVKLVAWQLIKAKFNIKGFWCYWRAPKLVK